MATTVTGTRPLTKGIGGGKPRGPNGNGSSKRNGDGHGFPGLESSANRYRIGMWVALASILMLFTALSSAYIVRAASANDWQPLRMPRILLLSTALILISSGTLEAARRNLKGAVSNGHKRWLLLTVALGVGFLVSQLFAWRQLVRQGVYVASNPHSSFFYVLTAVHGAHLLGGLAALAYLLLRRRAPRENAPAVAKAQAGADAVTLYWHFMDFLWVYLFVLLFYVR
ncbi:MAG TPA: cytochrome c oxidase subunit 3 [Pyrinomonadaceae bacterium]|jgi:cytochrome c oxidase subunit 3|nr:cytochrome c oxidase subunit 3 [Pyrinomonadaceae bacterium]